MGSRETRVEAGEQQYDPRNETADTVGANFRCRKN